MTLLQQHEQVRLLLLLYDPSYVQSAIEKDVVYAKLKKKFTMEDEQAFLRQNLFVKTINNDYTLLIRGADHIVFKAVYGCVLSEEHISITNHKT